MSKIRTLMILAMLLFASNHIYSATNSVGISIDGCLNADEDFVCFARAYGGSGEYLYWWQYSGGGHLQQADSPHVNIYGCTNGGGSLTVHVLDLQTLETAGSSYEIFCGGCAGGPGLCDGNFPGF